MSATSDFYLARAEDCARSADGAMLENVRDRFRRSEAAWRSMADRLLLTEEMRSQKRDAVATAALDGLL
jgi:hypothetical protein